MKYKLFAFFAIFVLLASAVPFSFGDTIKKKPARKRQVNPAVALLPASDVVATIDIKRFFGQALPTILASNQPILSQITSKLDEIQSKSGIDLRQFDQVAIGASMKQIGAKEFDADPVVIARGSFNLAALVAAAKIASNGTYREERVGDKTISVFSLKDIAQKNAPTTSNSNVSGMITRSVDSFTREIAVIALNTNTLAIGSLARVKQTVDGRTHVDVEVSNLLSRKPGALMSFAARTPTGMSNVLPLDNDELGKNLESIRYLYGSVDVANNNAVVQFMARTSGANQAQSLLETLQGLQVIGKAFLGGATGPDKQVFGRMIDNAQIARTGTDVTLDLSVAQSDIDILVGKIK